MTERQRIGIVIEGSLSTGLVARLDPDASIETMRVGNFVVADGMEKRFFCLIKDVALSATNPQILQDPPSQSDALLHQAMVGTGIYGTIVLEPMLMIQRPAEVALTPEQLADLQKGKSVPPSPRGEQKHPEPVKTVPSHFTPVLLANEEDFRDVFGTEEMPGHFAIGTPLDMDVPVCIDLRRFVERSNGIFGKSGTGKSFLARLLLAGIIKNDSAVNLIFDMHNEYGWETKDEQRKTFVPGLQQIFGAAKVAIFTLDPQAARRAGQPYDMAITMGMNQITIEDILLLSEELNLRETAENTASMVERCYKERWIKRILEADTEDKLKELAEETGAHVGALGALQRSLRRLEKLDFIRPEVEKSGAEAIMEALKAGKSVVLQFGGHNDLLAYGLVANIITRHIHEHYVKMSDHYRRTKRAEDEPRQLMITIEEAHKFLSPQAARQTIFGTIAREMRKYNVTIMVIDQRPSGIDSEVLSQIGTRVTALLNDERDIEAVFTGVSGAGNLRAVLAKLDPIQQVLVMGYAVPMPVVLKTRTYDHDFAKALNPQRPRRPDLTREEATDALNRELGL